MLFRTKRGLELLYASRLQTQPQGSHWLGYLCSEDKNKSLEIISATLVLLQPCKGQVGWHSSGFPVEVLQYWSLDMIMGNSSDHMNAFHPGFVKSGELNTGKDTNIFLLFGLLTISSWYAPDQVICLLKDNAWSPVECKHVAVGSFSFQGF